MKPKNALEVEKVANKLFQYTKRHISSEQDLSTCKVQKRSVLNGRGGVVAHTWVYRH